MNLKLIAPLAIATLMLSSCSKDNSVELIKENDSLKMEIEELYVKIEATEAQLLNISAELSKCKMSDSTKSTATNIQ